MPTLSRPIGLGLAARGDLDDVVDWSRRARDAGLDSIWIHDSYFERDAVTFSTAVADALARDGGEERFRLALGAVNPFTRHPVVLAMTGSALDELLPERIVMGLGTGLPLRLKQMGIPYELDAAVARLSDTIDQLRQLWAGERLPSATPGLPPIQPMFPPTHRIPLVVAANRREFLALAGQKADGYLAKPAESIPSLRGILERVGAAATAAGRDPRDIESAAYLLSLTDKTRREALNRAKREPFVIYMMSILSDTSLKRAGFDAELRDRIAAAWRAEDYTTAGNLIPDELLDAYMLCGTREDVAAGAMAFHAETGLDLPLLQPVLQEDRQIDELIHAAALYAALPSRAPATAMAGAATGATAGATAGGLPSTAVVGSSATPVASSPGPSIGSGRAMDDGAAPERGAPVAAATAANPSVIGQGPRVASSLADDRSLSAVDRLGRRAGAIWEILRPFAFTASIVPVAAGGALAAAQGLFEWLPFLAALAGAVLLHSGTNTINEIYDVRKGIDTITSPRMSHAIVKGRMTERAAFVVAVGSFVLAVVVGVYLVWLRGLPIVVLGLLGLAAGWTYTAPPFQWKYKALGVPLVFLLMGPLMTVGAYFAVTGTWSIESLILSVPVGLLTAAILHGNEWRDISEDTRSGIATLSAAIGRDWAHWTYLILVLGAYMTLALAIALAWLPATTAVAVLSLPFLARVIRAAELGATGQARAIAMIDLQTARLHLAFGSLLVVGVLLSAVLG
jgi:1,4-dihydroxy-2-naphthoate octaprenyltransferase